MAFIQRITVTVPVDASGDATVYSPSVSGRLVSAHYVKTDYANGVDFVITSEATGQILWDEDNVDASAIRAPRQPTYGQTGVASLYAAAGTAVEDKIVLANDRIKIVVANGGVSKTGTFHFMLE